MHCRRRTKRCRRTANKTSSKNPLLSVLGLFSGGSVFTADYYSQSGGKVTAFIDWLDATHTVAQATGANQVSTPSANSALNNAMSATFTTAQYYVSNRAASTWKYLHDTTGSTTVAVFSPDTDGVSVTNNNLYGTVRQQDFAAQSGVWFAYTTTSVTGIVQYAVANSTATRAVNTTSGPPLVQSTGYCFRLDYLEGAGTEFHAYKNGTLLTSGNSAAAPGSGNPQTPMTLGANASSFDRGFAGKWSFLATAPRILTAGQVSTLSAYLLSKYGVAGA